MATLNILVAIEISVREGCAWRRPGQVGQDKRATPGMMVDSLEGLGPGLAALARAARPSSTQTSPMPTFPMITGSRGFLLDSPCRGQLLVPAKYYKLDSG